MNPIQQAIEQATAARDWLPTICGELSGLDVPEDDANMRAAIAGLERVEGEIDAALTSLRSLNKEVEGVELPPLPEPDERTRKGLAFSGFAMEAYARAAVAAALGRERVPHGWKLVPVEPTPEMRKAAADAWLDCDSKLLLNKAGAAVRAATAASKEPK